MGDNPQPNDGEGTEAGVEEQSVGTWGATQSVCWRKNALTGETKGTLVIRLTDEMPGSITAVELHVPGREQPHLIPLHDGIEVIFMGFDNFPIIYARHPGTEYPEIDGAALGAEFDQVTKDLAGGDSYRMIHIDWILIAALLLLVLGVVFILGVIAFNIGCYNVAGC